MDFRTKVKHTPKARKLSRSVLEEGVAVSQLMNTRVAALGALAALINFRGESYRSVHSSIQKEFFDMQATSYALVRSGSIRHKAFIPPSS